MPKVGAIDVSEAVHDLRKGYGLTQSEVCLVWGRPQTNLSRIENGRRKMMPEAFEELEEAIHRAARVHGYTWKGPQE
jgi:transcriptional regulator with XRE-family HTH domain